MNVKYKVEQPLSYKFLNQINVFVFVFSTLKKQFLVFKTIKFLLTPLMLLYKLLVKYVFVLNNKNVTNI